MKIKEEHMIDFLIGFLFLSFIIFIFNTSIKLASSPESISEGIAIIYVALLTGLYYIFSRKGKSNIVFTEKPVLTIARTLGVLVSVICIYFLYK